MGDAVNKLIQLAQVDAHKRITKSGKVVNVNSYTTSSWATKAMNGPGKQYPATDKQKGYILSLRKKARAAGLMPESDGVFSDGNSAVQAYSKAEASLAIETLKALLATVGQ